MWKEMVGGWVIYGERIVMVYGGYKYIERGDMWLRYVVVIGIRICSMVYMVLEMVCDIILGERWYDNL